MKVTVKDFVDMFDDMSTKDDRANFILDNVDSIVEWYVKKGSHQKGQVGLLKELVSLINTKKFFKSFKYAAKIDNAYALPLCGVIADYLETGDKYGDGYKPDSELVPKYSELMEKILSKKSIAITKKSGLPADMVINCLVSVPSEETFSPKHIYVPLGKVNRKMYIIAANWEELDNPDMGIKPKQISALYGGIFGKEFLVQIALQNLLVRKDSIKKYNARQIKLFNAITSWSLTVLNDQKKKELLDLFAAYIQRRKADENNSNDGPRRVKLQEVDAEEYPRIAKAIEIIISDNPEFARFL